MKHMKVAEARARFGEVLDEAERGADVVIERRGVRFRVVAELRRARPDTSALFEFVDEDVMKGHWSWKAGADGLVFMRARKRR